MQLFNSDTTSFPTVTKAQVKKKKKDYVCCKEMLYIHLNLSSDFMNIQ